MQTIHTDKAPAALGPYAQAIEAGGVVYTSGQLGMVPDTGALANGLTCQTVQALENLTSVLKAAGLGLENVVKTTCFLQHMDDFSLFNEIYAQYFTNSKPARSCVEVARLPKGALVEIEAVAVKDRF